MDTTVCVINHTSGHGFAESRLVARCQAFAMCCHVIRVLLVSARSFFTHHLLEPAQLNKCFCYFASFASFGTSQFSPTHQQFLLRAA